MCPLEKWTLLSNFQSKFASLVSPDLGQAGFLRARPSCGQRQDSQQELSLISVKARWTLRQGAVSTQDSRECPGVPSQTQGRDFLASRQRDSPFDIPCQAGNGAGSKPGEVLDVLTQYRGLSWR